MVINVQRAEYLLEPVRSRWDTAARQRSYEGSSVALQGGRLLFTPGHDSLATDGWSLPVGPGAGQVAKIVHVHGFIVEGAVATNIYLDRYGVLDADGRVLAIFPSGVESDPFLNDPWFPMTAVAGLAASAGVVLEEAHLDSLRELLASYPGIYGASETNSAKWNTYFASAVLLPMGLGVLVAPFWYTGDRGFGVWVLHVVGFGLGAIFACYGLLYNPPILWRYRQWSKGRRPDEFTSPTRRF